MVATSVEDTTVLSSTDVATIYGTGVPNDISSLNPLAWYRMGENANYKSPQWLMPENSNFANSRFSNYSFEFDGVDDFVTVSNFNSLASVNTFTVSFWAKFNSVVTNDTLINHYSILGIRAYLQGSKMRFLWQSQDGTNVIVTSTNNVTTGTWKHYACTYDNTDFKLFENGSLVATTNEPSKTYKSNLNFDLIIGKYFHGVQRLFDGFLDEIAIWDSVQDVNAIYNGGVPTTISGATNHYRMGEEATFSTNWTIPDQVGSNDGTSSNMTIEDRVGNAPNSDNNSVSFNMVEADRETDVPT